MNLTDDEKRYITEKVLGECWHESFVNECNQCKNCNVWKKRFAEWNRTFTTHQDLAEVYGKLVESGEWEEFQLFLAKKFNSWRMDSGLTAWLFCLSSPSEIEGMMVRVAEWWEQQKEGE